MPGDVVIPVGEWVVPAISSANRDPAKFRIRTGIAPVPVRDRHPIHHGRRRRRTPRCRSRHRRHPALARRPGNVSPSATPTGTLSPSPRPHDRRQLSRGRDANVSTAARIRRRARRPAEGSASSWISWLTDIAIPLSTVARSRAATFDRSGRAARTSAARKDSQRVTVAIASSNAVPDRAHVGRPAGPPAGGRWQGSAVCAHLAANARHDYCARGSGAARMARSKRATVRGNGSR